MARVVGDLGVDSKLLSQVVEPGTVIGSVIPAALAEFGLPTTVKVVSGTTGGCASFIATGAAELGDGVTALGDTLTLKLLSPSPVFSPVHGVHSHRLGERWLVGGTSNSGGAALQRFFTSDQITMMTGQLRPERASGRTWHPLPYQGECFPVADPDLVFDPVDRPHDDVEFFQALLEGIADVEARAYRLLAELGAPPLRSVRTVGSGARNNAWTALRERRLNVPLPEPLSCEAAYGTALLALRGLGLDRRW